MTSALENYINRIPPGLARVASWGGEQAGACGTRGSRALEAAGPRLEPPSGAGCGEGGGARGPPASCILSSGAQHKAARAGAL